MYYLHTIDPVALALGPLKIHWYGLMYLLAFGSAWLLGRSRIRAGRLPGVDDNAFGDLMFYGMLGVVLGGRIGYVLFYGFGDLLRDPAMIIRVWEGGMSFHGGLLGVLVACAWWAHRQRLRYADLMDFVAPLVPLGLGFGRLGNYIGGELWGKVSTLPWAVIFPSGLPPQFAGLDATALGAAHAAGALDAFARHPSQLYEALLEGLTMFALLWWFSRKPRARYAVSGVFALLYGCFRFAVEFVRVPDLQLGYLAFDWLTMGQVLSLPLIVAGLVLLAMSVRAPTLHPVLPEPNAK